MDIVKAYEAVIADWSQDIGYTRFAMWIRKHAVRIMQGRVYELKTVWTDRD